MALLGYVVVAGRRLETVEDEIAPLERTGAIAMEIGTPTAGHFIFIPVLLLVGVVIGWVLGSRAARRRDGDGAAQARRTRAAQGAPAAAARAGRVAEPLAP